MPVEVGEFAVGGFIAVFVGVIILAGTWYARSRGHLRNKTAGVILVAVAVLIILYSMGFGTFIAG